MVYILMFFLAFWAGFSVRRGSICLVRATNEIIERKPPKTMLFVIEAMVVALFITVPAMFFFPEHISLAPSYDLSLYLLTGAGLYGMGAAMNDACALGTLNQVMNGKIEYTATILGVAVGFIIFLHLDLTIEAPESTNRKKFNILLFIPLMFLVWGIVLFKSIKFFKQSSNHKFRKFKQYLTSPVARDFIGVSIFGFCGGVLYLLLGRAWDYTKLIMDMEYHLHTGLALSENILPTLTTTLALVSGMIIATVLSRNFTLQKPTIRALIIRFLAGALMGGAVGFIPGGNDTILLHGIPGIAFHAPVAIMVMMSMIAVVFIIKKRLAKPQTDEAITK